MGKRVETIRFLIIVSSTKRNARGLRESEHATLWSGHNITQSCVDAIARRSATCRGSMLKSRFERRRATESWAGFEKRITATATEPLVTSGNVNTLD